jgi:uncharacterized DUF497 family protein
MSGFDWDDANRQHIARHGVSVFEAEEAFRGPTLDLDRYTVFGEVRYEDLGATASGRILKLVTTDRSGLVRIMTAFDASQGNKQDYLRAMVNRYE